MSFFLDPLLLFIFGGVLYFLGDRWKLAEQIKIAMGLIIVFLFISVSVLLCVDAIPCFFPILCGNLSGSQFMFHSDTTGIYINKAPPVLVILLFAMYPLWHYAGYAFARKYSYQNQIQRNQ